MAIEKRQRSDNVELLSEIKKAPDSFEFHALMKLLEVIYDERVPVGEGSVPHQEVVRFRQHLSLSFAGSDIHSIALPEEEDNAPVLLEESFFGLAGANGPLPMTFTQRVLQQTEAKNFAMRDFLDIFNHRLLSIFHKVRKSYWIGVDSSLPEDSMAGRILTSFVGAHSWLDSNSLPIRTILNLAVSFWERPRSCEQLCRVLSVFLRMQTAVEGFCGNWRFADHEDQTCLGKSFHALGQDVVLGRRMWDPHYLMSIKIIVPSLERYYHLLPGSPIYSMLCRLSASFLDGAQKVRFHLEWEGVTPQVRLGDCRLGYTSWLCSTQSVVRDKQTYIMGEVV